MRALGRGRVFKFVLLLAYSCLLFLPILLSSNPGGTSADAAFTSVLGASLRSNMAFKRVSSILLETGRSIVSEYSRNLEVRPVLTKCITSGAISAAADVACQKMENKKKSIDVPRLLRFTLLGALLVGSTLHHWYGFLARRFPDPSIHGALKRLAFDQFVFAPAFIATFMSCSLITEGRPEMIPSKLSSDWVSAVLANYSVWVPAQFLNFKFIAPGYQVLFSNMVGFGWNIYMSYVTHKGIKVATAAPQKSVPKDK